MNIAPLFAAAPARPKMPVIVIFLLLAIGMPCKSKADSGGLFDRVKAAHSAGLRFTDIEIFRQVPGDAHTAVVTREALYEPLLPAIQLLLHDGPESIGFSLTDGAGIRRRLELTRSYPLADAPDVGSIDQQGRHPTPFDAGIHYQGCVQGAPRSIAAMSVYRDGTVMLLFADSAGNFNLGRIDDGSGRYVLYNDRDLVHKPTHTCEVPVSEPATDATPTGAKTSATRMCKKVQMYWEIGYDLYSFHGSLSATHALILGEFNQLQALYANDSIAVELKSLYVWNVPDEYGLPYDAIINFAYNWGIMGLRFGADLGHFISRGTYWGYGYVNVLCNSYSAVASSRIISSYSSFPVYSNDLYILAHETGHNLGSWHTQSCVWPTGPGGSCGAIDDCGALEPFGCTSCTSLLKNTAPPTAWRGTVMSYCESMLRGVNLSNGFGQLPGDLIRQQVNNGACLKSIVQPRLTPQQICNADGAIRLSLPAGNFGVPPYTYLWSNGSTSQNLVGLSVPGQYRVVVTDANGCRGFDTVRLRKGPASGVTVPPGVDMPLCCGAAQVPLLLSASLPGPLSSCETVSWLRSEIPLATQGLAKSYFDTARASDVLASSNADSASFHARASLAVMPPATCTTAVSVYYTPIVTTRSKPADSIIASSAANTPFKPYGPTIGTSIALPDQTALLDSCGAPDSLQSRSLLVTVTSYTGRANRLRILVSDSANIAWYDSPRLAGNGTYLIPDSALGKNFGKAMIIRAFEVERYDSAGGYQVRTVTASASARRVIRYKARPPRFIQACSIGSPIRVDFAPQNCTPLGVGTSLQASSVLLYPNPATDKATLRFALNRAGRIRYTITDIPGRTIMSHELSGSAGENAIRIDAAVLSKGVYKLVLSCDGAASRHIRFVVR